MNAFPRKARAKSPEVKYTLLNGDDEIPTSCPANTITSLQSQYQGDSYTYELGPVTSNVQSRAVISITGNNDTYYRHQNQQQQQPSDFIHYIIQPGDTLHNLSVKYSCPKASIKRLNNLWSDQEFYGLTKIKLPVGRFRLIADVIQDESGSANSECDRTIATTTVRSNSNSLNDYNDYSNHQMHANSSRDPKYIPTPVATSGAYLYDDNSVASTSLRSDSIFRNLDQHIERAREAAKCYDENASDIMKTLAQGGNLVADETNMPATTEAEKLLNDLSDFGLSYNFLILFIFIVCLVCPLAYVIYLEETHRDPHHHDISHSQLHDNDDNINSRSLL